LGKESFIHPRERKDPIRGGQVFRGGNVLASEGGAGSKKEGGVQTLVICLEKRETRPLMGKGGQSQKKARSIIKGRQNQTSSGPRKKRNSWKRLEICSAPGEGVKKKNPGGVRRTLNSGGRSEKKRNRKKRITITRPGKTGNSSTKKRSKISREGGGGCRAEEKKVAQGLPCNKRSYQKLGRVLESGVGG